MTPTMGVVLFALIVRTITMKSEPFCFELVRLEFLFLRVDLAEFRFGARLTIFYVMSGGVLL